MGAAAFAIVNNCSATSSRNLVSVCIRKRTSDVRQSAAGDCMIMNTHHLLARAGGKNFLTELSISARNGCFPETLVSAYAKLHSLTIVDTGQAHKSVVIPMGF